MQGRGEVGGLCVCVWDFEFVCCLLHSLLEFVLPWVYTLCQCTHTFLDIFQEEKCVHYGSKTAPRGEWFARLTEAQVGRAWALALLSSLLLMVSSFSLPASCFLPPRVASVFPVHFALCLWEVSCLDQVRSSALWVAVKVSGSTWEFFHSPPGWWVFELVRKTLEGNW